MENVATYTRPPTIEVWNEAPLSVFAGEVCIADGPAIIYREAGHPPNFYFDPEQVKMDLLERHPTAASFCEYKGFATYYDVLTPPTEVFPTGWRLACAAWTYLDPNEPFLPLKDCIAFYPNPLGCYVGEELVTPEDERGFYGGWVWSGLVVQ